MSSQITCQSTLSTRNRAGGKIHTRMPNVDMASASARSQVYGSVHSFLVSWARMADAMHSWISFGPRLLLPSVYKGSGTRLTGRAHYWRFLLGSAIRSCLSPLFPASPWCLLVSASLRQRGVAAAKWAEGRIVCELLYFATALQHRTRFLSSFNCCIYDTHARPARRLHLHPN